MASRQQPRSISKRHGLVLVASAVALLVAACGGSSGGSSSSGASSGAAAAGSTSITLWHGYAAASPGEEPSAEYDSMKAQVDAFMKANPNIKVTMTYVNSDDALQKLTVALQGGKAPDVTYQYGTNVPQRNRRRAGGRCAGRRARGGRGAARAAAARRDEQRDRARDERCGDALRLPTGVLSRGHRCSLPRPSRCAKFPADHPPRERGPGSA